MAKPELVADPPFPSTGSSPWVFAHLASPVSTAPAPNTVETWQFDQQPPDALCQPGQYHFVCGDEICIDATGGTGTSRSIIRGVGGTISTHPSGANLIFTLVADAFRNNVVGVQSVTAADGTIKVTGTAQNPQLSVTDTIDGGQPDSTYGVNVFDGGSP